MLTFDEYLAEKMKDPEFAREWERLEPEYAVINAILDAEQELGLTQSEFAERCGMKQSALSRLQTGKKLVIQFV